jgi:hypothetical protein
MLLEVTSLLQVENNLTEWLPFATETEKQQQQQSYSKAKEPSSG